MSTDMQIALVGVIGTLAGTILGWVLTNISQRGKLNPYIASFTDSFTHTDEMGFNVPSSSIEQAESYSYKIILDLYNSSGATKIMRNIVVVFSDGKKELHKSVPMDDSTGRCSNHRMLYDEVGPINIPPKSIIQLSLRDSAWYKNGGLDFIWNTKKVYLTYTDEKNTRRTVKIKAEDYSKYFENHKSEESENG